MKAPTPLNGSGSATNANNVFSNLGMGEYFPTVEDANGCEVETGDFLNQPSQLISDTVSVTPSSSNDGAIDVETSGASLEVADVANTNLFKVSYVDRIGTKVTNAGQVTLRRVAA